MKKIKILTSLLLVVSLVSCAPYKQDQVLFDYADLGCVYYLKTDNKSYKYSEFIYDDISNGEYKTATPNIADYRTGKNALDYDIPSYVNARMDFVMKKELIAKHEIEVDNMCDLVRNENFIYNQSYVYFYDESTKRNTLLCDSPVTNIAYDNEFPRISFDVENENTEKTFDSFRDRKIKLSDIIAANATPEAFMKVLLSQGKEKRAYIMDRRIDNDEMYGKTEISSKSTIN